MTGIWPKSQVLDADAIKPKAFTLLQTNDEPLLTLHFDGRVTVSDKMAPDEAGRKALQAFLDAWPVAIDAAREDGRRQERERFADFGYEIKDGQVYSYGMQVRYPEDEVDHMRAWQAHRKSKTPG
jgi:hypothetical protein